jgi:hypothetical protein
MKKRRGISTTGAIIAVVITVAIASAVVVILRFDPFGESGSGLGEQFVYDDKQYRRTDPNLIHYRELQPIETGLKVARGIAVRPDDAVYVAGDKKIVAFDRDGKGFLQVFLDDPPQCLAVEANGTIYVGMIDHVAVYSKGGRRIAKWASLGKEAVITSIALSDSDVFIADSGNSVVLRYDKAGRLLNRLGQADKEKDIPGLLVRKPCVDVAVENGKVLWVVNPGRWRVESYSFDGKPKRHWGRQSQEIDGFCGCCNPTCIAVLPNGWLITGEKGLPRVKICDETGCLRSVVAGTEAFAKGTAGLDLAVDSHGRVLVLDRVAKAVRVFVKKEEQK